jgi:hypothetical protein
MLTRTRIRLRPMATVEGRAYRKTRARPVDPLSDEHSATGS